MNEIKVNLSIVLRGSTMFSKEECLKTTQETITNKNGRKRTVVKTVEDWEKMEKHTMRVGCINTKPEIIVFHTRKCKPATQSINMNKDAYEEMTSKSICPAWVKPGKWNMMSRKERLESHLQKITEHLGGVSFTYQVFED